MHTRGMQRASALRLILGLILALVAFSAEKKTTSTEKMTGCVDQKDGRYILTGDHTLRKVAELEAVGFQQEGFAKYVGNRVALAGEKKGEGDTLVLRVRTVRQIGEGCPPAGQATR